MLKMSIHGVERIQGRTGMLVREFAEVIDAGATIEIGRDAECRFLLVYSPAHYKSYIALVNNEGRLVSVWNDDFKLPECVGHVTWAQRRKAKQLYLAFVASKQGSNNSSHAPDGPYRATLYLYRRQNCVASRECREVRIASLASWESIYEALRVHIATLARVVEESGWVQVEELRLVIVIKYVHAMRVRRRMELRWSTVRKALYRTEGATT